MGYSHFTSEKQRIAAEKLLPESIEHQGVFYIKASLSNERIMKQDLAGQKWVLKRILQKLDSKDPAIISVSLVINMIEEELDIVEASINTLPKI